MPWLLALLTLGGLGRPAAEAPAFERDVLPVLKARCGACHGAKKAEGGLDVLSVPALLKGGEGGPAVTPQSPDLSPLRQRVEDGEMPPPEAGIEVTETEKATIRRWIEGGLQPVASPAPEAPPSNPNRGNLVPHERLFGQLAGEPSAPPPGRIWRLRPEAYDGFVRSLVGKPLQGLAQPFGLIAERGFKDYAALYAADEATTEILVRNAEQIVAAQTASEIKDGAYAWRGRPKELAPLFDPDAPPTPEEVRAALRAEFALSTAREPTADELDRLLRLHEKNLGVADRAAAARATLAAILLRPDCIYRTELGTGPAGVRMLAPREIALAVSLALGDRRDQGLFDAAGRGELATREQVAAHVRRLLDDPKAENPRLLRFFREYFGYDLAPDVFKDRPEDILHRPQVLVRDTDLLVLDILARDRDVLRELLTTRRSFANYKREVNKKTKQVEVKKAEVANPHNDPGARDPEAAYGLDRWTADQPVELPEGQRAGILTQPSWLVAHSTSFDNDVVRRGRWVRERLLGGTVPDLPIGVAAQVPTDRERPLRDRMAVTRQAACWKCHDKMDELGLPFEQYDHLGRYRDEEAVLDPAATAAHVDRQGKPLGPVHRRVSLDTRGSIAGSGDPALDGPVSGPAEMMGRLAASDRVRQVFVRHAFRYFLGRNESFADAPTLQEADRAYVRSGGSFKALVVSLLASDAFLLRSAGPAATDRAPE